jgi:hypothetical protein
MREAQVRIGPFRIYEKRIHASLGIDRDSSGLCETRRRGLSYRHLWLDPQKPEDGINKYLAQQGRNSMIHGNTFLSQEQKYAGRGHQNELF